MFHRTRMECFFRQRVACDDLLNMARYQVIPYCCAPHVKPSLAG